jgi:potassium efflux system protein
MFGRYRRELKATIAETSGRWGALGDRVAAFFNRDVADTDDESVTVGQMLLLATYVAGGILLAYLLSRVLGRHLFARLGFGRGTIVALRSIVFYVLCLVFGLVAFQVLDISLTAFAFIGGAAAIAIGFGSQDIMNNFMSGIILLTEQPIRVGDIVELSKVQGAVLHIGLRSTRLQTETNHEVIVPNKMLLDESVTNLTLSDNVVQLTVTVALERTADVEKTKRDMLRIAFLHPLVVKSPQPVVLVTDFDSYYNQLTWEVHFWVQLTSFIKCAMVKSDILEHIAGQVPSAEPAQAEASAAQPSSETPEGETTFAAAENGDSDAPPTVRCLAADPALMSELKKMGRAAIAREMKRVHGPG